jgi:hypothetical protein
MQSICFASHPVIFVFILIAGARLRAQMRTQIRRHTNVYWTVHGDNTEMWSSLTVKILYMEVVTQRRAAA